MRLIIILLFIASKVVAQNIETPKLEFVCELKVTVDKSLTVGLTAHGERRIIPITGGTFEGPKLKGKVLNGGADYQFGNKENTRTEVEAIYTIQTDDGILIHIRNVGIIYQEPSKVDDKNSNKLYFTTALKFEAPITGKYDWMNNAIFICKGVPAKDYVSIQVWRVD